MSFFRNNKILLFPQLIIEAPTSLGPHDSTVGVITKQLKVILPYTIPEVVLFLYHTV